MGCSRRWLDALLGTAAAKYRRCTSSTACPCSRDKPPAVSPPQDDVGWLLCAVQGLVGVRWAPCLQPASCTDDAFGKPRGARRVSEDREPGGNFRPTI